VKIDDCCVTSRRGERDSRHEADVLQPVPDEHLERDADHGVTPFVPPEAGAGRREGGVAGL
jgi:hypothetical protein